MPYFQDSNLRGVLRQLFAGRRDQLPDLGLPELSRAPFGILRTAAVTNYARRSMPDLNLLLP